MPRPVSHHDVERASLIFLTGCGPFAILLDDRVGTRWQSAPRGVHNGAGVFLVMCKGLHTEVPVNHGFGEPGHMRCGHGLSTNQELGGFRHHRNRVEGDIGWRRFYLVSLLRVRFGVDSLHPSAVILHRVSS